VGLRPRLNVRCGRCGKPREGLRHVCRSNSRRKATIKLAPALAACSRCGKPYGNPLTHTCRPKSDFRSRKAAFSRKTQAAARKATRDAERSKQRAKITAARDRERQRSAARIARLKASYETRLATAKAKAGTQAKSPPKSTRPRRPPHEYQACADNECQRPMCVAFKTGYKLGDREGYERGWKEGYDKGFPDGIDACPRAHQ
jgi:hypothetical protein